MLFRKTIQQTLCATLLLCGQGAAAEAAGLSTQLATRFSGRWNNLQKELEQVERQLVLLPDIPAEPLGGTSGLLALYSRKEQPADQIEGTIDVHWDEPHLIDQVSLIPARIYTPEGLNPEYRTPSFFTIDLIDASGNPVARVAEELAANARPIRRGFPFTYELPSPVKAHGVRIRCRGLTDHPLSDRPSSAVAWAELFCFAEGRNVAQDATIALGSNTKFARRVLHRAWNYSCLTDGQTPLGLPEKPAKLNRYIGWCSFAHAASKRTSRITIRLPQPKPIDTLHLYPTRRTELESTPGFAMPRRFSLIGIDPNGKTHLLINQSRKDLPNPGQNPFTFYFEKCTVQEIQLVCYREWKSFPDYPAFLAFSEIQLLDGDINRTRGLHVEVPDHREDTPANLTDGYGIQGELIPRQEWLKLLNHRLELETQRKQLQEASSSTLNTWARSFSITAWSLFSLLSLIAVGLPIFYRLRERQALGRIRQRIADNLHDEVGANLGSIAINSEMLEHIGHLNTAREREMLADIRRTSTETATEIRLLTRFLDKNRVRGDLLSQFNHIIRQLLPATACTPEFSATKEFNALPPVDKWELLLFFKEALHNIAKHAQATQVDIRTRASGNALYLKITDDGVGLKEGQPTPTHLTHRAEKLHAQLEISHPNDGGTTLLLRIPKRRGK